MKRDLLNELVLLSAQTQKCAEAARQAGDELLVKQLRSLAWSVASLLADHARGDSEVVS